MMDATKRDLVISKVGCEGGTVIGERNPSLSVVIGYNSPRRLGKSLMPFTI